MLSDLSRAVEERDETQGHGARVAALAVPVAERLDWDGDRIASLRLGAPLHDIGKVAVPRDVLCKRGALTSSEREAVQRHPRAGASLVLSVRRGRRALPFVLFHHERWDGRGYPSGLRGHSIPLEARLLAVADAYDAMVTERPYRAALPAGHALGEIEACAGSQFDPEVAAAFLAVWRTEVRRETAAVAR